MTKGDRYAVYLGGTFLWSDDGLRSELVTAGLTKVMLASIVAAIPHVHPADERVVLCILDEDDPNTVLISATPPSNVAYRDRHHNEMPHTVETTLSYLSGLLHA